MNIICDLDGTISLDHKRNHHLHPIETRNWDAYFDACHTDEPCHAVIELLSALQHNYDIYILSGRSHSTYNKTLKWLGDYDVPFKYLQLRGTDDRTHDDILKLNWAKEFGLTPSNTLFVLEDRQRVVDMWRLNGYRVFQVASGNF